MKIHREYLYDEPFYLQWHITDACNLSCKHCYNDARLKNELSLKNLLEILNKYEYFLKTINRRGRIQFSGGEPFLSPYLFTILKEARNKNISCRVLSNGLNINHEHADKLIGSDCCLVQISIEGDRVVHNNIRGEGTFEKTIEAIDLLNKCGIEVTINMTISKMNLDEIDKVINITSHRARRFSFARFVPTGKAEVFKNDSVLTPGETYLAFKKIFRDRNYYRNLAIPLRDPLWHEFLKVSVRRYKNAIHGCSIGFNGLTVDTDGTIYPCRRLPISLGNALETDFIQIWRSSSVLNELRDRDLLKGKCHDCKRRWLCGGCRAVPYALTKDYLAEDPQCFCNTSFL